jgi:hypothetical protein
VPHPMKRNLLFAFLIAPVAACGGAVTETPSNGDAGTRRDSGRGGSDRDRSDGSPSGFDARPNDDFPVYREDACPDAPPVPPVLQCDPFQQSTCPLNLGCYPIPPRASGQCQPGRYSTMCLPTGPRTQGDPCSDGTDCAGGFICVKSGQGDQCVKLCRTTEFGGCDDGRVCREVDVSGSGLGGCE